MADDFEDYLRRRRAEGGGLATAPLSQNPYSGYVGYSRDPKTKKVRGNSSDYVIDLPLGWRTSLSARDKAQLERLYRLASNATGQPIDSFDDALAVWEEAVKKAERSWTGTRGGKKKGSKPTTPWDELLIAARERQAGIKNSVSLSLTGGRGGAGSETSVTKSIDEISDGTAWSIIDGATRQMLGRAPTEDEVRRFISRAHDISARNPNITTVTSETDGSGHSRETSKTKRGATGDDYAMAAQKMAATPEAAAYQAATTYMSALMDAIESPVDFGNVGG